MLLAPLWSSIVVARSSNDARPKRAGNDAPPTAFGITAMQELVLDFPREIDDDTVMIEPSGVVRDIDLFELYRPFEGVR
jgi:hypothetical protein